MIQRLERIEQGQIKITDYDIRFYTHELRELERFRELGIPDGEKSRRIISSRCKFRLK